MSQEDILLLPPPPDPEPVTEEILAWRGWELVGYATESGLPYKGYGPEVDSGVVRLKSLTRLFLWEGPSVTADRKPSQHSQHGLYAMRTREQFTRQVAGAHVIGQVALSGIVVEGENGYRAERATIRSLIILCNPFPDVPLIVLADRLAATYQCEVTWEIKEPKIVDYTNPTLVTQIQNAINAAGAANSVGTTIFSLAGTHLQGQSLWLSNGLGNSLAQGLGTGAFSGLLGQVNPTAQRGFRPPGL